MSSNTQGRIPIVSGNWKMNHNHFDAIQFVQKLSYLLTKDDYSNAEVTIHPPFTDIRSVQTLIDVDEVRLGLGAQHCHWEDKGAFTGEVSALFLSKLNVRYVICGHSERRELFGQTDDEVNRLIVSIVKAGMTPIVCVGETLTERESGRTTSKVMGQVASALQGRTAEQVAQMVIAYEPIWAIGTGRTATAGDAQAVVGAIRSQILESFGERAAMNVRLQYGGSVKASNIVEIMSQPDIDGVLVGGASLDPTEFARIVQYYLRQG
jgi:triosephosphate isomerase